MLSSRFDRETPIGNNHNGPRRRNRQTSCFCCCCCCSSNYQKLMAPPKADGWPAYIFNDPDVLTLDERGRFIICHVCAEYYATCGGKKPKPVTLNGCYRTRAWEVHKQRTRAHNTRRGGRGTTATRAPVSPAVVAAAASYSFGAMLDRQPYAGHPLMDHDEFSNAASPSARGSFDKPPPNDRRRRSVSPSPASPRSAPITTWRPHHAAVPAASSFSRGCERAYVHNTSALYTQLPRSAQLAARSIPLMQSTLVFPLVRRPSELRSWSDFDPARCETSLGYDWRRRPRSWSSTVSYEQRSMSRTPPPPFPSRVTGKA